MFNRESSFGSAVGGSLLPSGGTGRPDVATLLATLTSGTSLARDPRAARERFEEELRVALQARAVVIREDLVSMPPPPNVIGIAIPLGATERRVRLEAVFDAPKLIDDWTTQILEAASHVVAILLELERAGGPVLPSVRRPPDGAAPLIGSSEAIRRVRDRIERVAATDFTVLVEGATGPEPHSGFIEVFD